jgi:hypothetical protein
MALMINENFLEKTSDKIKNKSSIQFHGAVVGLHLKTSTGWLNYCKEN